MTKTIYASSDTPVVENLEFSVYHIRVTNGPTNRQTENWGGMARTHLEIAFVSAVD